MVDDENFNHEIFGMFLAGRTSHAMMPNESGFSFIEKLRANPQTVNLPIILWTVLEQPDGSVMDATKKADFTVCKPF